MTTPGGTATSAGNFTVTVPTPTLSANPTALTGFTYVEGFGPSATQTYRLTGNNLPANFAVTVTAPTNYEVSQDNATFGSGFTVSNFSATDVYVRLEGGLPVGDYNNELVVNTGGGAAQLDVPLSGSVTAPNPVPAISSLSPNTAVAGSGSFTLTVDGTGFISGSTVSFNGTNRATTFVSATRLTAAILAADIATAGTYDVVVTNAAPGGGASAAAPFTVTAPVPTLTANPTALSFSAQVGGTTAAQSYALSGTNLPASGTVTITAPASFEVSVTSATAGFASSQTATTTAAGSISQTVWVRFVAPATPGTTGPADVTNVIGSNSVAVAVTGTATAAPVAGAPGELLLEDDFNGTVNSLLTANGWTAHGAAGNGPAVIIAGNLAHSNYPVGVNQTNNKAEFTGTGEDINKAYQLAATQNTVYVASLQYLIPDTDYFMHLGRRTNASGTSLDFFQARVFAVPTSGGRFRYGLSVAGTSPAQSSTQTYSQDTTYLVVLKYTYNGTAAPSQASLYVFRPGTQLTAIEPAVPTVSASTTLAPTFSKPDAIAFRQTTNSPAMELDGVRVGTGWGATVGNLVFSADGSLNRGQYATLELNGGSVTTTATATGAATVPVIENSLTLTSGILTTSTASPLTLLPAATVTGGNSSSFVNGPVARQAAGAGPLLFPVGKGMAYRPLTVNVASQAAGTVTYTAEQKEGANPQTFDNAASALNPLTRVSNIRRYTVTSSDNTGFNGNIQLSFGADDDVSNPSSSSLVIGKNNGNGWFNIGRVTSDASTVTSGNFTSFSDFALASTDPDVTNNPLPVELIRFTAQRQTNAVRLDWATASEQNNARFEVQRSADGAQFRTLATVAGQGTTAQRHAYSALDRQPLSGTAYYRLRQVDTNGQASFSPVVAVAAGKELALYPNPAHTELQVVAPAPEATYRVLSTIGAVLLEGRTSTGSATLNVASLPAGLYHLEVTTAAGRVVRKFTKQD